MECLKLHSVENIHTELMLIILKLFSFDNSQDNIIIKQCHVCTKAQGHADVVDEKKKKT